MQKIRGFEPFSPVELLVHLTIDAHLELAVIEAQREFESAAGGFSGHLKSETRRLSCTEPGTISFVSAHTFDSADHLIRWLESDRRNSLMQAFKDKFDGHYQVHYPHARDGLSAWLNQADSKIELTAPSRWKTNLIVLTALYPLTLLIPALLWRFCPSMNRPTTTLLTAIFAVSALGFVIVPLLSRGLTVWLRSSRLRNNLMGAIGMAVVIATIWQIACLIDG